MCLLNYNDCLKNNSSNEKNWSYTNQANWKTYQNYYSTIRSPINIDIDINKVIKFC
jgi:hypothetical protein